MVKRRAMWRTSAKPKLLDQCLCEGHCGDWIWILLIESSGAIVEFRISCQFDWSTHFYTATNWLNKNYKFIYFYFARQMNHMMKRSSHLSIYLGIISARAKTTCRNQRTNILNQKIICTINCLYVCIHSSVNRQSLPAFPLKVALFHSLFIG
jgi:hypothetical protein